MTRHFIYFRNVVLFFVAVLGLTDSHAQLKQTDRFEKEYRYHDQDFIIVPLEREGLSLIREKNKFKSGKQYWEVILLDSSLHEKHNIELEIDLRNEITGYEYASGFLHLLFTRKETKGEMGLVSIRINDGSIQQYEINPELAFVVRHFCKVADRFALGGYVNMEPAVLIYTPATNNIKVVPGFFSKNTELIDMRANKNQTFNTLVFENGDRSSRKVILRTFDPAGKQLFDYSVPIDEEIMLHSGICSTLELEELVLIGTWGRRNSKQSLGYYSIVVNPFEEAKINRTYFGGMEHYLDYLKPKKVAKIKARTTELVEKGKFPDFTNHVMPFEIIESNKKFLFLSESYIPVREDNRNTMSPYNSTPTAWYRGYYPSNNIYSPYYPAESNITLDEDGKTIQGALVAFSPTGAILWDYSIKLDDIRKSALQQTIDFHLTDHNLKLLYKKESDLKVKSIDLSTGEAIESAEKIQTLNPGDEIRSEERVLGEIKNWYGNTFYTWGYQSIRNRTNPDKTRDVFYVNKVVIN